MGGERAAWLPGYRVKILDGNHLAGTEHRLKELRTIGAGALPGHALVVLDPQAMLVTDVFPCEDGHAQERSLLDQVLETIRPGEVWIADRNFCTTGFLFGIARRGGYFVIRQHGATLHIEWMGERRPCGRSETGAVFEQEMRLGDGDGGTMVVRRITVELDTPTRDGETEIHILTNLPAEVADALAIADLYRRRWTVEAAFGELATCLNGEVNTLGYPKAALFAFCVALVSYNVMSVVKAALRSVHGEEAVEEVVVLLPGRRGGRDAPGDDDRHPGGRVGGVPRADGGGVRQDPAGPGRRGPPVGLPQAASVARSVRSRSGRAGRRSSTSPLRSYWRRGKGVHNSTFKALGWMLIIGGLVVAGIGLIWILVPSLPRLGRLPGHVVIERRTVASTSPS